MKGGSDIKSRVIFILGILFLIGFLAYGFYFLITDIERFTIKRTKNIDIISLNNFLKKKEYNVRSI